MTTGDRVRVVAMWSPFYLMCGRLIETEPYLMVILDGYRNPVRLLASEIALEVMAL